MEATKQEIKKAQKHRQALHDKLSLWDDNQISIETFGPYCNVCNYCPVDFEYRTDRSDVYMKAHLKGKKHIRKIEGYNQRQKARDEAKIVEDMYNELIAMKA